MIIESYQSKDTFRIGETIGQAAKAGEIYGLVGDLGVGKTVFSQGFAKGLGIVEPVNSPTFTIVQEYQEGRLPFYHFDVYRLEEPEELEAIGYEEYFYSNGVCLIEWPSKIKELLPKSIKLISIEKDIEKGFDYRLIRIEEERNI